MDKTISIAIAPVGVDPQLTFWIHSQPCFRVKNLSAMRKKHHLTYRALAQVVGVSVQFLCDIEHGRRGVSLQTGERLTQVFVALEKRKNGQFE